MEDNVYTSPHGILTQIKVIIIVQESFVYFHIVKLNQNTKINIQF